MTTKTYSITKTRRGRDSVTEGTVAELTEYFGYTLQAGHSYNSKINTTPTTAKSLVSNLNKAVSETMSGSFDPDYYELNV